ncbi:hypothetical protein N7488_004752 [Penicillium malachiteum]|nr:hypothetical protein N7488_004752 [Penicillium malachiteum]
MLAGSCTWILSKPEIPPLLDPDLMQVPKGWLWWVSGIPSSGKTNVATSLIQTLNADRCIAYFFCETQKPESLDVVAILRTWVWQLLQKIPEKVKEVAIYFERGDQPSRTNMRACLQTFISANERPLFILDGLDEMDYDRRETFYTSIAGLDGLCDILVLSRELPDIFDGLSQAANDTERALYHLRIVENDTKNDIQNFIHREVDRLNLSSTGDQQLVRRALAEKAKGMFVWMELILKHLKQRKRFFREQIVDQLDSLPDSLGELYARILQRLFEQRDTRAQTTLLFKWIACSEQPLKLTELSSVLNIKENETQPRNLSLLPT